MSGSMAWRRFRVSSVFMSAMAAFLIMPVSAHSEPKQSSVPEAFDPFSVKTKTQKFEYKKGDPCSDKRGLITIGKVRVGSGVGLLSVWIDMRIKYKGVKAEDAFGISVNDSVRNLCRRDVAKFSGNGSIDQSFECIKLDNEQGRDRILVKFFGPRNDNVCGQISEITTQISYSQMLPRKPE